MRTFRKERGIRRKKILYYKNKRKGGKTNTSFCDLLLTNHYIYATIVVE